MVYTLTGTPQQSMQPTIPKARPFARQLDQLLAQDAIVSSSLIPVARSRNTHELAGVPFPELELPLQPLHFRSFGYELNEFFRMTDCSASLSNVKSVTKRFRRAFSSRNCFTSCASLTSMPP